MVTESQRAEFEQLGILRISGAVSRADAARMSDAVWDALAKQHGVRRDDPGTWKNRQPTGFQTLSRSGTFDSLGEALAGPLDELLGEGGWLRPKHWGVPLVTVPAPAVDWDVPSAQWHLDFPARGRPAGLRVLAFLDRVEPRAGGTLVLVGSHRL